MKNFKLKVLVSALVIGIGAFAGSANAELNLFLNEQNQFDDEDAEQWIDRNNNQILDVGDTLRGILQIDFNEGLTSGQQTDYGAAFPTELTALFEVEVTSFTLTGNSGIGGPEANYEFGVYAPFATEVEGLTGQAAGSLANTMVAFWEESTSDAGYVAFDTTPAISTYAAAEATATGGEFVLAIGDVVDDDFWVALDSSINPDVALGLPLNTEIGGFDWGLSLIYENTNADSFGLVAKANPLLQTVVGVQFAGNGDVFSSGFGLGTSTGPYALWTNTQGTFLPERIPEPATLFLLGGGLMGLGASRLRRRNRKDTASA
jgi:hypothetical protein